MGQVFRPRLIFPPLVTAQSIPWQRSPAAIDKISLRWFVTFSAFGLLAAMLVLWRTSSIGGLLAGLFLLRFCGQGLLPHTAITTMTREFTVHRGKAVSIAASGVPLGEIILPSLAVFLIATFGWQKSWLVIGLSIPLLYLPAILWLLDQSRQAQHSEEITTQHKNQRRAIWEQGTRSTLLKDHRFWLALPAILAAPFIITGLFIHQGFFLPEMGWTPLLFAGCFVFYGISHWLSSMFTGALVDRFSGVELLKFYPLPMLLGLAIAALISGNWVAYALMILVGASIGAGNPIISALWAEAYGTRHLGAIRALVSALAVLSTSISPLLFGLLIDGGISGQTLFLWLTVYVLLAIGCSLFSFSAKQVL